MSKINNILIVDDHPFIIEAYKNALKSYHNSTGFQYTTTQAGDCKAAYDLLTQSVNEPYDIAFLDISMPGYEEKQIMSGEDLAKMIRASMPDCKIIMLTMHTELIKINNIIKDINPNGLMIKNDLTFDELLMAFDKILNGQNYYTSTVIKFITQGHYEPLDIDDFDKQIVFHLAKGIKTKDLSDYIPLSLSAIEKRKQSLKELLNIKEGNDIDLVRIAKEKGVI